MGRFGRIAQSSLKKGFIIHLPYLTLRTNTPTNYKHFLALLPQVFLETQLFMQNWNWSTQYVCLLYPGLLTITVMLIPFSLLLMFCSCSKLIFFQRKYKYEGELYPMVFTRILLRFCHVINNSWALPFLLAWYLPFLIPPNSR